MSWAPYGLTPPGYEPTGAVLPTLLSKLFARLESHCSPLGYSRPSTPRAAFSHSASVGNRWPAHWQYALASCQVTPTTGWVGPFHCPSLQYWGAWRPVASVKRR